MPSLLGIARFQFHEGRLDEFKRLSQECMRIVRERDTGTLRYDIYLNADESEAVVIEEYVDLQALIDHMPNIGDELSQAILSTGDVRGEILGELSDDFRAQLDGGPVQPFAPFLSRD